MKGPQTVADYNKKRRLEILKAQCFNNACVLHASGSFINIQKILDTAEELYAEAMKRNYHDVEVIRDESR